MSSYSYASYPSTSYSQYQSHPPASSSSSYYGNAGYPPPAPSYPSPIPSQQDTQAFRTWCSQQLSALVENNRTIIHGLSYMAQQHASRYARVIAECIEQHIRKVHPAIKLPAWYLLDSIAKNLGSTYTPFFSSFVTPLFLESYDVVDDSIRNKMEEMLVTWRTGGPGGVELFGQNNQTTLERAVWGNHTSSTPGGSAAGPSRSQVLMELDVILTQKNRAVQNNPADVDSRNHIDVLHQLRTMVQTTNMSSADLTAIMAKLRDLARSVATSSTPAPAVLPPPQHSHYATAALPAAPVVPVVPFSQPPPPPTMPLPGYQVPAVPQTASSLPVAFPLVNPSIPMPPAPAVIPPALASSSTSAPAAPTLTGIPDVSALFKNLVAAGIIKDPSAGSTSTTAPADDVVAPKIEPIIESAKKPEIDPKLVAMREYENRIMTLPVALSGSGLQRLHPILISMMYDELPLKCRQCSKRFADTEAGRKARDDHLDAHFKQNKRASLAAGRGHGRSWFVGMEDWMNDISMSFNDTISADIKGKGRADLPPTSAKAIAAAAAEREVKLRSSFVVIPAGDESKAIRCPVCKEELLKQFKEDIEEWIWLNAISLKGKIYHATCHADALASQAAARLRDQSSSSSKPNSPQRAKSRSRSGTPELMSKLGSPKSRLLRTTPPFEVPSSSSGSFATTAASTDAAVSTVSLTAGRKRKSPSGEGSDQEDADGREGDSEDEKDKSFINSELVDGLEEASGEQPAKRARMTSPVTAQ